MFAPEVSGQQIILIRHAKVDLSTKGWMFAGRATDLRMTYDTANVQAFFADTVLFKIPVISSDTIYTSSLFRSKQTAYNLFGDKKYFVSSWMFDEFELYILKLPLFLPYKGWTSISRFGWFVGFKRENTESHRQARKRVRLATDFIEEKSKSQKQVVLVAHGFLNRNISHKLSQRGWKIVDKQGKKNLGATVLEK